MFFIIFKKFQMNLKGVLFLPVVLFLACTGTEQQDEVALRENEDEIYFSEEVEQIEGLKREHPLHSISTEFKELENFLKQICLDEPHLS